LILDEPTRGIDVGAKEEIYRLLEQLAANGAAVLFIVSEFHELARVCNRALVMYGGEIVGELGTNDMNQQHVLALATGGGE
jgi:ribose transport system ATP-binding protein